MAKNVKKAKPAAKAPLKHAHKPVKKQAKHAAPPPKKAAPKAPAKPVAKAAPKKEEKPPEKNHKLRKAEPQVQVPKKAKPPAKVDAKAKKGKRDADLEDDLMVSDEDMGAEEIPDLSDFDEAEEPVVEDDTLEEVLVASTVSSAPADDEAILTDAEGRPYCKVKDCDQIASVDSYCRFHYLLLWKKIQVRRKILVDGKLERYVEELTSRYPDKFLEMIKRDLRTEKDFLSAIAELEIDESGLDNEFEDESQVLDEVRGFGSEPGMSDEEEF